ncbi:hypothetical protein Glove_168g23 [Diversispora epigaea]|uniref:Uncharacterized protein n=1 Tax=Diversispora epigaea TaxID=1348612 RepID=A0A397IT11_9GLOM|nr:hypothetical protein Glove_168g23 [Diversispora epigaea]
MNFTEEIESWSRNKEGRIKHKTMSAGILGPLPHTQFNYFFSLYISCISAQSLPNEFGDDRVEDEEWADDDASLN